MDLIASRKTQKEGIHLYQWQKPEALDALRTDNHGQVSTMSSFNRAVDGSFLTFVSHRAHYLYTGVENVLEALSDD